MIRMMLRTLCVLAALAAVTGLLALAAEAAAISGGDLPVRLANSR